jgi:hypothetical protein
VIQLKTLFETRWILGADQLEAIALVVPEAILRLAVFQQHNFEAILSMFGHDLRHQSRAWALRNPSREDRVPRCPEVQQSRFMF